MTNEEAVNELIRAFNVLDHSCHMDNRRKEAFNKAYVALKAEPCEDAVSLDGVIDTIEWYRTNPQHFTEDNLIEDIKGLPLVTPKPRTGKWIKVVTEKDHYREVYHFECSECGDNGRGLTRFCPNCGAKMEGA